MSAGGRTELFDLRTRMFTPGPALREARGGHTATTLLDGRVLVIGGGRSVRSDSPRPWPR